jgi:DNA-binding IclR family transcriptional regulator
MAVLAQVRARGHAVAVDCFQQGMAAIAVPVRPDGGPAMGCLSIAGPSVRLTPARLAALLPALQDAAARLAAMAPASALLRRGL